MFGNQQANPKAYSGLFTIVVSFDHFKCGSERGTTPKRNLS